MKKIIAIAAALGAAAVQLSAEKANYFDIAVSAPVQFVSERADSETRKTDIISVAVGISSRKMFTTFAGLYAAVSIAFPQKLDFKGGGSYGRVRSDYSNLFGFDFLIGPAVVPVATKRFSLVLDPGLHFEMLSEQLEGDTDSAALTIYGGIAADIFAQFRLTKFLNISAGVQAAYDFLMFRNRSKLDGRKTTVSPKIAVGFTL